MVSLVFFAIFVAGIITGGFLMMRWVRHQAQAQRTNQQAFVVPVGPMMIRQMLNQLDLTRDQRKAANKVLFENADAVRVLRREADFAIERMHEDVAKILSPDQQVKFEQLMDDQRAKLQVQREKVRQFLEQSRAGELPPAVPPPQPPPAPAPAPMQPAPAH